MQMTFMPFPRGQIARGTPAGTMVPSPENLNTKGVPLLEALHITPGHIDHAQVIIAGEFLSKALRRCLRAHNRTCPPQQKVPEKFSCRIRECHGRGLTEKEPHDAMVAVKDIRNRFAHKDFQITLDSDEVKQQMEILRAWFSQVEDQIQYEVGGRRSAGWQGELIVSGELAEQEVLTNRHVFLGAVIMLYLGLTNLTWQIDPGEYKGEAVTVSGAPGFPLVVRV
jgi:hypothetical protein